MATAPKAKDQARVFLFSGEDGFARTAKLKNWIDAFEKKYGRSAVIRLNSEEQGDELVETLAESCEADGLFSSTKLIVASGLFERKAESLEPVIDLLNDLSSNTFLVLTESSAVKKSLRLYKKIVALEKAGRARIYEFEIPAGAELNRFIAAQAKALDLKLSPAAAERLAVILGRDLQEKVKTGGGYETRQAYDSWQIRNELEKLKAYKLNATVEPADIDKLVLPVLPENVFLLAEALGRRNPAACLRILNDLMPENLPAVEIKSKGLSILGALGYQFRTLLQLASAVKAEDSIPAAASALGWNSYRAQVNSRLLAQFSMAELMAINARLLEIDHQQKSTTLPPKFLFSQLVMEFCQAKN